METDYKQISELLLHCEEKGDANQYLIQPDTYKVVSGSIFGQAVPVITKPVEYKSDNEEIFVVSDLHIASGKNKQGVYRGTENFFSDDCFARFLADANAGASKNKRKSVLVINGDVFDFLRVVEYPGRQRKARLSKRIKHVLKLKPIKPPPLPDNDIIEAQFKEWENILEKIGISVPHDELRNINNKEKTYGLKTHDYKSVWKLHQIQKGHDDFFNALALWIQQDNRLVIVKGNHDTEWCWSAVRNYFRLLLAERIANNTGEDLFSVLKILVLKKIDFFDDSMVIDNDFYLEHGHRYDKYTFILDDPKFNEKELNIPFGSFFNRYLLNRIELFYPYLDNVRPSVNVLPILLKENFALGLKVLFQHLPFTFRMIFSFNGRYVWFMFKRVIIYLLFLVLPVILFFMFYSFDLRHIVLVESVWNFTKNIFDTILPSFLKDPLLNMLKGFGSLFLSYLLARFVAWFQLSEPDSLETPAKERIKDTSYRIAAMGHTHNPGAYIFGNKYFYNTGTWIPVIETSNAEIREDKTYTFLHLERDSAGKLIPANNGFIQRWNDDACRPQTQILTQRK